MNSQEKLHLLTSKLVQIIYIPAKEYTKEYATLLALDEQGRMWQAVYTPVIKWHLIDSERILPE